MAPTHWISAMRSRLVVPGVPNGMPAAIAVASPLQPKPRSRAVTQANSIISPTSSVSRQGLIPREVVKCEQLSAIGAQVKSGLGTVLMRGNPAIKALASNRAVSWRHARNEVPRSFLYRPKDEGTPAAVSMLSVLLQCRGVRRTPRWTRGFGAGPSITARSTSAEDLQYETGACHGRAFHPRSRMPIGLNRPGTMPIRHPALLTSGAKWRCGFADASAAMTER